MKQFSKLVWSTTAAFALVVAMGAASPAAAQGKPEVSGGYQFTYNSTAERSIPAGWYADVAFPLNIEMLSVVGEVNGAYKDENNVNTKTHSVLGGIRYALPARGKLTPFAQVLFGVAHSSVEVGNLGSSSDNNEAIMFGGGVKFALNDRWSAKVGVDYRRIKFDSGSNEIRIIAGVIIPIGS